MNRKDSFFENFGYTVIIILLLISGIGLAGLGASLSENYPKLSPVLLAAGGTFFGGVVTLILGFFKQMNVLDLLRQSLQATFRSPDSKIDNYRKMFHQYHLTETKTKGWQWMYIGLDFSQSDEVGALKCRARQVSDENDPYPGNVEAGIRRERFIIMRDPDNGEPTVVAIFPDMAKGIPPYSGISVMHSWKRNPIVTRVILGEKPIKNWDTLGIVSPEVAEECDRIWNSDFKSNINPLIHGMSEKNSEQN